MEKYFDPEEATEETDKAISQAEELIANWHQKQGFISIFIGHEPLKEIETSFVSMKAELEQDSIEDFFVESELSFVNLYHFQ